MKQELDNDEMMRQYLLGELSEQEQTQFEERYFVDDELFEELLAVEDELIDDYVRKDLSAQERERFESHYLSSPQERQKVGFARALERYERRVPKAAALTTDGREEVSWWQSLLGLVSAQKPAIVFSSAMVTLVMVVVSSGLMVETMRLRKALEQIEGERAALERQGQELQQQVAEQQERGDQSDQTIATLVEALDMLGSPQPIITSLLLSTSLRSDEGTKPLVIPQKEGMVELRIDLEGHDYKKYRAVVQTPEGKEIWKRDELEARPTDSGKVVVLRMSAGRFVNGDYIVKLSGVSAQGDRVVGVYPLMVRR